MKKSNDISDKKSIVDRESLRCQLQIDWQDHFQTRAQSWKILQMQGALILGFIAADYKITQLLLTLVIGGLLILTSIAGFAILITHYKVQIRKFSKIRRIEVALGFHDPDGIGGVREPYKLKLRDIFFRGRGYTAIFMIRLQLAIMVFILMYLAFRIFF